jgi:hypothetical protein
LHNFIEAGLPSRVVLGIVTIPSGKIEFFFERSGDDFFYQLQQAIHHSHGNQARNMIHP